MHQQVECRFPANMLHGGTGIQANRSQFRAIALLHCSPFGAVDLFQSRVSFLSNDKVFYDRIRKEWSFDEAERIEFYANVQQFFSAIHHPPPIFEDAFQSNVSPGLSGTAAMT